jgi:tRNA pseudouridine32 synthase / 23S rRNA pseudouridine746 synthase
MRHILQNLVNPVSDLVIFIDGEAVVIDKPVGLPVNTPRKGGLSVEVQLPMLCFGFQRPPFIVHRLDQDTSGCLLLARNPKAQKRFNATFEAGNVEKTYVAVLEGTPEGEAGMIDLPIAKVSSAQHGWHMVANADGKAAVTHWRVLGRKDALTLIEFKPETGRTHQLRVHALSGLGLPILGDPLYGNGRGSMMLHASRLVVQRDGKPSIEAASALPERFAALGFAL